MNLSNDLQAEYVIDTNLSYYDFAAPATSSFPHEYFVGFLSQRWVQEALGVPLNFTEASGSVYDAFNAVGDTVRGGLLEDIAYVLDSGVKVALVYGDRDFACNWIGGENVSLNIPWSQQKNFKSAGYTDLRTNNSYVGGQVRQYGNLSFSRIYESGHEVPAYQPETAYQIFYRALFNRDIATGTVDVAALGNYSTNTSAPKDTWSIENKDPPEPKWVCYTWAMEDTCTEEQIEASSNGSAVVKDWIYEDANSTALYPGIFS